MAQWNALAGKRQEIADALRSGATHLEIGERFGVTKAAIQYHAKKLGVVRLNRAAPAGLDRFRAGLVAEIERQHSIAYAANKSLVKLRAALAAYDKGAA